MCDLNSFTSTILSPVFRVPLCPAGLSARMCLIKIPLITSPLLRRLPIPRPPTMLMPRDLPGSLNSSTLRKVPVTFLNIATVTLALIRFCKPRHALHRSQKQSRSLDAMCKVLTFLVGSSCCRRHFPLPLHPHAQGD